MLFGQLSKLVIIDALVIAANAVGNHFVGFAREVERVPVREVAAMRQVHSQDRVAGLKHGGIGGLIGL